MRKGRSQNLGRLGRLGRLRKLRSLRSLRNIGRKEYILPTLSLYSLNSLNSLNSLFSPIISHQISCQKLQIWYYQPTSAVYQFFVRRGQAWSIAKEIAQGQYYDVQPWAVYFSDGPRMTPYHEKLLQYAEFLTYLNESLNATIKLLCSVTCRNLNTDTSLALWYYGVVETCYEYTLLLELCCEVL